MGAFALSASKVALGLACPGAFVLPHLEEKHDGQDEGNELHEEYEDAIDAGEIPDALVERWPGYTWRSEVAFAVDLSDGSGREIGSKIARAYKRLLPSEVPGTVDALGEPPTPDLPVVVVDFKSYDPRVPYAAVNPQLHTLALAVCRTRGVDECEVAIHHEMRPLDVAALNWTHLEAIHGQLRGLFVGFAAARRQLREGTLKLTTGSHCRYCPAFMGPDGVACPEQRRLQDELTGGLVEQRVEALIPFNDDDEANIAYELLPQIQMLAKRLRTALFARAAERPIPLRNGKMFGYDEENAKRPNKKLDGDITYDVLRKMHGQEFADAATKRVATQSSIEDAIKAAGMKPIAAKKKAILDVVDARNGVIQGPPKAKIQEFVPQSHLRLVAGGKP
jgi:hypothetical protein